MLPAGNHPYSHNNNSNINKKEKRKNGVNEGSGLQLRKKPTVTQTFGTPDSLNDNTAAAPGCASNCPQLALNPRLKILSFFFLLQAEMLSNSSLRFPTLTLRPNSIID
jgi:hypothetical protein